MQLTSTIGTAIPALTTMYDSITGHITTTTMGTASVAREYDKLGRLFSYTDADGAQTRNEFDPYGRPSKVVDPTGNATFAYDRTAEPRGFVTSVTDSIAGTFGAKYSADGQLVEMSYPGGLTRKDRLDANLSPVQRTYTRDGDSAVVWSESIVTNSSGQWVEDSYTGGSKRYGYDRLGRLISTQHTTPTAGGCVTRQYAYDARSNRTLKRTFNPALDGSCRSDVADMQEGHGYDSADRLVDSGYGYDVFGRTTSTPAGLANTYFVNDLVASQQLGDARQGWTLDPAHRLRGFTTDTLVSGTWTAASSKLNHYGDDSDEVRWVVEDTTTGALTRNVSGPDGDLAATTSATGGVQLQLGSLHGDTVVVIDTGLSTPAVRDFDEFGSPVAGQPDVRYGWLGAKQRSAEALGGVVLMGVRLYSPALGRFLQVDPVDGGSATAYDYCHADPVNCTDLDGRWGLPKWAKKTLNVVAKVAEVASLIPGPIGAAAAGISAVSYAATGNWRKAGEMALTAAANLVGCGAVVKVGFTALAAVKVAKAGLATGAVLKKGVALGSAAGAFGRGANLAKAVAGGRTLQPTSQAMRHMPGDEVWHTTRRVSNMRQGVKLTRRLLDKMRTQGYQCEKRGLCGSGDHLHIDWQKGRTRGTIHIRWGSRRSM